MKVDSENRAKLLLLDAFDGMTDGAKTEVFKKFDTLDELCLAARNRDASLMKYIREDDRPAAAEKLSLSELERIEDRMNCLGVTAITCACKGFPEGIAERVLYLRGNTELMNNVKCAVVGSRSCSSYGEAAAKLFAGKLAERGITVVSGLAAGVDGAAHSAAVGEKGSTIAVLGCGADVVYPRENAALYDEICEHGLIVSAYPVGTKPAKYRFVRRNLIISGLSKALVLAEAGASSGALITANSMLANGGKVFVVTGSIFSQRNAGGNAMIARDPSSAAVSPDAVLKFFKMSGSGSVTQPPPTDATEAKLFAVISKTPVTLDELSEISGIDISALGEPLFNLELNGYVEREGNLYKERLS